MQVTVKGQPIDLLINTVSITPEPDNNALYMFHCINCGSNIQKYQGRIAKITPVLEPYNNIYTYPQCRKCGTHYSFQVNKSKPAEQTRITLFTNPIGKTNFFCYAGRGEPMLTYSHDGIYSHIEHGLVIIPFISRCVTIDCPEIYYFNDLV